ncbi:MAG: helix-turn-helix domain-containing protein [Treponema sp.]|jgi:transcriptional regulator with XRE-family HTH domain|nr:helix-turn-helix domain-containing protein [Treponema sp.]
MSFKGNLKDELSYKNMLVKELADKSGVNKRTIDNYLREKGSIPSAYAAVSIAKALGVSVEYLVTGHTRHRENAFASFSADTMEVIQTYEKLDGGDRKIVLNLSKSLLDRENAKKRR